LKQASSPSPTISRKYPQPKVTEFLTIL
jgi:hypothetical protein